MSTPSDDSAPSYSADERPALAEGQIVVPILEGEASHARSIALDVASETESEVVFVELGAAEDETDESRATGGNTGGDRTDSRSQNVSTRTVAGGGRTGIDAVEDAARELNVGTIVLENGHRVELAELFLGEKTIQLANELASNVFVVTGVPDREPISSILVPVGGGPYSELALSFAEVMARAHDAWIDVYHVVDPDSSSESRQRAEQYVRSCADRIDSHDRVDTWVQEAPDVSEAIIEQTGYYDLTVLGSPTKGRLRRFFFGSTTDDVQTDARNSVVTVRSP